MTQFPAGLFHIIPASRYHAQVLAALHQACFTPGWADHDISGLMSTPGTTALAALAGAETSDESGSAKVPFGFILYRCAVDECEIITLCVRPQNRRQGAAKHLLSALEDVLVGCGVTTVSLEVEEGNTSAVRLYEKAGYVLTGRRKNYYRNEAGRRDAMLYRRTLEAPECACTGYNQWSHLKPFQF